MFNSQKINNDPNPWLGPRGRDRVNYGLGVQRFEPRPEYDNNPNPILVEFRSALDFGVSEDSIRAMFSQLNLHLNEWRRMGANEAQIDHARKVLTRLVNIFGTER